MTPPRGSHAKQWIGISLDEVHRARDSRVKYIKHEFPLLDLKWTRNHCIEYLQQQGWGSTPKSACVGCPFHSNYQWRDLRDNYPDEWQDAIEFDEQLRNGYPRALAQGKTLNGHMFLHRSRVPLAIANLESSNARTSSGPDLFTANDVEFTCSPFSCRADEVDLSQYEVDPYA